MRSICAVSLSWLKQNIKIENLYHSSDESTFVFSGFQFGSIKWHFATQARNIFTKISISFLIYCHQKSTLNTCTDSQIRCKKEVFHNFFPLCTLTPSLSFQMFRITEMISQNINREGLGQWLDKTVWGSIPPPSRWCHRGRTGSDARTGGAHMGKSEGSSDVFAHGYTQPQELQVGRVAI